MMKKMSLTHFGTFAKTPYMPQGVFGRSPLAWAARNGISPAGPYPLSAHALARHAVRTQCQPPYPVAHGYITAMAWGMQGSGPGGSRHALSAWADFATIQQHLTVIRSGAVDRKQAYDLFKAKPVPGLGPSYFTKLIFFFMPSPGPRQAGYIMDQWTGKSINLLAGDHVVRMYGDAPHDLNTSVNYEAFCTVIDQMGVHFGQTGDEIEQRLFSQNGMHGRPRGKWRQHVLSHWNSHRPTHSYDEAAMLAWVRRP